ncbi:PilN domain-containing protein [Dokdonella sp. MW10]|uniref:PilN domain-containing protein n=1 Tax=Dokdonella sp. MW10 TaxID=2992926 RepID=UPI003F7ED5FE
MARINLLPWRAERRKQREREFYMMLGASAAGAALVVFLAYSWMGSRIEAQNGRNTYLTEQIKLLDTKIERIKDLEKTRDQLLARKQIIEDLQSNRSQMVHMFNELAQTIPDGTRLTSLKQAGEILTLEGVSESNTRVATYMRNVETSPNLGRSDLAKIENMAGKQNADRRMPYEFQLAISLRKPSVNGEELPLPGADATGAAIPPAAPPPAVPAPSVEKKP